MTFIDCAREVVRTQTCHLLRARTEPGQFDCKMFGNGGKKKGWFYLDLFSASAVTTVYDAINPENQAKLLTLSPPKIVSICFQMLK